MVVEPRVQLILAQPEQHLAHDVDVRDDAHHRLDERAEHVRVDPHGDALDALVRAPIEHHARQARVQLHLRAARRVRAAR